MQNTDLNATANCVYCLDSGQLTPEQVLLRGEHFYLCAPRGQMVEGFLVIAPYRCYNALAKAPLDVFDELRSIQNRVRRFYGDVYKIREPLFYEQGRGGGGARTDPADRFPLHAHLCSLPARVDLHALLGQRYLRLPAADAAMLPEIVCDRPYFYVEACSQSAAYVANQHEQVLEIEKSRLKPIVAELMGISERGDWRSYPGERELMEVIKNWRRHCEVQA